MTAGAKPIKESRNVTTLTAKKMVHRPIPNCLFFFLKSVTTYRKHATIVVHIELDSLMSF